MAGNSETFYLVPSCLGGKHTALDDCMKILEHYKFIIFVIFQPHQSHIGSCVQVDASCDSTGGGMATGYGDLGR